MYQLTVFIDYKESVVDPHAKALEAALKRQNYQVDQLTLGRRLNFRLAAEDLAQAKDQAEAICQKVLANLNLETYRYEIEEA